jgi:hypothetical protein
MSWMTSSRNILLLVDTFHSCLAVDIRISEGLVQGSLVKWLIEQQRLRCPLRDCKLLLMRG